MSNETSSIPGNEMRNFCSFFTYVIPETRQNIITFVLVSNNRILVQYNNNSQIPVTFAEKYIMIIGLLGHFALRNTYLHQNLHFQTSLKSLKRGKDEHIKKTYDIGICITVK